ncbi:MAG: hypothetical protein RL238_3764 [Actinomycetota bacterium]|jgi:hypothetical protein
MAVQLLSLAHDALDPAALSEFWSGALRWVPLDGHTIGPPAGDRTSFVLQFRPTDLAKTGQNRIHFDLNAGSVAEQSASVDALLARGAAHIDIGQSPEETHVVLADPEGNELCVIGPTNFLATCPRLGAVNCDGTHELGVFWSRALGWPLVWDHEEETAVQAPSGDGPKITWSGTPLMPGWGVERIHFHVAPADDTSAAVAIDELLALGATRAGHGGCDGAVALVDVDGNRFCLVTEG